VVMNETLVPPRPWMQISGGPSPASTIAIS
jgi:hypothetical protein